MAKTPVLNIFSGKSADPIRPPGYYLFLKSWTVISDHLFWIRLSTIFFFVINGFFVYKLAKKTSGVFAGITLFLYTFSGYFLIFDWQARMYTGALTFMLLSLYALQLKEDKKKILLFTVANVIGLYFDISFFWYFFSLPFYLGYRLMKKRTPDTITLCISYVITLCVFAFWLPSLFSVYSPGTEAISWMKPYLNASFSVPFLIGSHDNGLLFTVLYILLVISGLVIYIYSKNRNTILSVILCTFFVIYPLYIFSLVRYPVFHLRSIEIAGLTLLFLTSETLNFLYVRRLFVALYVVCMLIMANFFFTYAGQYSKPGQYLVAPYPWKSVTRNSGTKDLKKIVFSQDGKTVSDTLIWSLQYSLDGKETLFSKKIPFENITGKQDATNQCDMLVHLPLDVYICR